MAQPTAKLPHLLVSGTATSEAYTAHGAGSSRSPARVPNRMAHGKRIRAELEQAQKDAVARRGKLARPYGGIEGVYLEFESPKGVGLALESLEATRSGIELVAVRSAGNAELATVFVPEKQSGHFLRIVDAFLTKESGKSKRPKNEALLATIANVRAAVLESLWTDEPDLFPPDDTMCGWEIWLRLEPKTTAAETLARFRKFSAAQGITVSPDHLVFPDRLVVHARAQRKQLSASIDLLSVVAELRLAKESAEFFTKLGGAEQRKWAEDLVRRTTTAPEGAPAVCVLDTGVNHGHPLLAPSLHPNDLHSYQSAWGVDDHHGHGTEMAGLALLGDLTEPLSSNAPVSLTHRLESAKILPPIGQNPENLWGTITNACVMRAELSAPQRRRVLCLAVTAKDTRDRGQPSSWSAEIDALSAGVDDAAVRRLFVVSAGNINEPNWAQYPANNESEGIHDPGQAWNALTVGAYTEKVRITEPDLKGWRAVATAGDLSPCSSTSLVWQSTWPLKPDLVMEGGNAAIDPAGAQGDNPDSLSLLSTYYKPPVKLLVTTGDTSAAAALAARMAAQIHAQYPDFWPETVRGLMVHSAEWKEAMRKRYNGKTKRDLQNLLRSFGFGVPDLERALWSARNSLTLLVQESLQPFEKERSKEMHLHRLPWPMKELRGLGETRVQLRVTLSYFIEPNPGRRGWNQRHRYASHGLRFDVKTPTESLREFRHRINKVALTNEQGKKGSSDASKWLLGPDLRSRGSIHSDRWEGTAAELAERGYLAVFPVVGWWRERHQLGRWELPAQYSLIVTIHTPDVRADIYTPVQTAIAAKASIPTTVLGNPEDSDR